MTQEEKLEEAKRLYETANADQKYVLERLFPELEESEDEKIRKHLIKHFANKSKEDWNGVPVKSILAWLEKQGAQILANSARNCKDEQKFAKSEDERIRKEIIAHIKWCEDSGYCAKEEMTRWIAWLEKQGEHVKFINGIQVGDKVTRNEDGVLVNLSQLNRVAKKDEKQGEQKPANLPNGEDYGIDGLYHAISILEKTLGKVDGYQSDDGILEHKCAIEAVNHLYKQKPAWSEEDEKMLKDTIRFCELYGNQVSANWLKSLKDRVQPQPKQEWSEEDERMMMFCCDYLDDNQKSWLLSLKERYTWKPSDEQISIIEFVMEDIEKDSIRYTVLNSFLEQLKKLREE